MELNKAIEAGVAGLVPVYEPSLGNVTRLVTAAGDTAIIKRTVKSVLRRVARHYGVDLRALKAKYAGVIGHYKGIPLPMTPELILISVKVREPLVRGDGCLAYLNLRCIKSYRCGNPGVDILLKNGISLKGLCTVATFKKHMRWGELVYRLHAKNTAYTVPIMYDDLPESYLKPATRADIALLVREILEIKGRLP